MKVHVNVIEGVLIRLLAVTVLVLVAAAETYVFAMKGDRRSPVFCPSRGCDAILEVLPCARNG